MGHCGDQKLLHVDPGRKFMGAVTKLMKENGTTVRCGLVDIHRDQAIVERFNRNLAERLFGHQYAVEMRLPEGQRSSEWVVRLPVVVSASETAKSLASQAKSLPKP